MLHNFSLFLLLPATLRIPLPAPSSPASFSPGLPVSRPPVPPPHWLASLPLPSNPSLLVEARRERGQHPWLSFGRLEGLCGSRHVVLFFYTTNVAPHQGCLSPLRFFNGTNKELGKQVQGEAMLAVLLVTRLSSENLRRYVKFCKIKNWTSQFLIGYNK